MLRSSAGNFYNYFRPGAGELIRSAEPRRFLSLSLSPPFPTPSSTALLLLIDLFFFFSFFFPLYLHHHLAFLTTHDSWSHRPFLSDSFFFFHPTSLSSPFPSHPLSLSLHLSVRVYQFSPSLALLFRERRRALARESTHAGGEYQNIWGCVSPALISHVRHYGNYRSAPVRSRPVATGESLHLRCDVNLERGPGIRSRIPRRARPFSGSLPDIPGHEKNNVRRETLASLQELRRL